MKAKKKPAKLSEEELMRKKVTEYLKTCDGFAIVIDHGPHHTIHFHGKALPLIGMVQRLAYQMLRRYDEAWDGK